MFGNKFCHFKHINNFFSAKYFFQTFVSIDISLVLWVLKIIFLIYTQSFLTTSDLGMGPLPTITVSSALILIGFINAELLFCSIKLFINLFGSDLYITFVLDFKPIHSSKCVQQGEPTCTNRGQSLCFCFDIKFLFVIL